MSATALYKALLEAKVSEESAEKAVEGLAVAGDVATKADISGVEKQIVGVEKQIVGVRTEIAQLEVRMVKWNIALHIAAAGLIVGMIKFWG